MNRNSIRWRLPVSYAVIALLAALSLGSLMSLVLRSYYADQEHKYLLGNAAALQPVLEQILESGVSGSSLQNRINGLSFLSQARIRLLDMEGNSIADSGVPSSDQVVAVSGDPGWQVPFFGSGPANAPEDELPFVIYSNHDAEVVPFNREIPFSGPAPQTDVIVPISASPYGYAFVAAAQSDPTRRSSQVVRVPLVASNGIRLGELEFSNGPSYGADVIDSVTSAWVIASVFAVTIAALAGWAMSRRVTRPVLVLENATRQMEQGNLAVRVDLRNEKQQEFLSLANSFNGMAKQVEQTISTLRAFVADAAHELHTPLTALQANLELAQEETNASDRTRYLARVREQGQRLEALVESLLDLSRIEAAESQFMQPVDIVQLVREVSEQFASRAEQTGRICTLSVPERAVMIRGNVSQLRRVVVNLLENALKFTPAGGAISVGLERATSEIILTVADSGIGIPSADLPFLFKRFHRARNVAEYPGSGLGLAIVKAIVDRHQGSVVIRSAEAKGTRITVSFPAEPISPHNTKVG